MHSVTGFEPTEAGTSGQREHGRTRVRKPLLLLIHPRHDAVETIVLRPGETVVVGRSSSCDYQLHDGSVSRQHLSFHITHGKAVVQDCQSRNGTHINGVPLVGPQPLEPGDVLQLGKTILVFQGSPRLAAGTGATRFPSLDDGLTDPDLGATRIGPTPTGDDEDPTTPDGPLPGPPTPPGHSDASDESDEQRRDAPQMRGFATESNRSPL